MSTGRGPSFDFGSRAPPRRERLADVILHGSLLEDHVDLADNSAQIDQWWAGPLMTRKDPLWQKNRLRP
jgi:hypothetical protein